MIAALASNTAIDDTMGRGSVPAMPLMRAFAKKQDEYALALRALRAPDRFDAEGLRKEASAASAKVDGKPDGKSAVARAKALIAELNAIEYEVRLIDGVLYLADVSQGDGLIRGRRKLPWLQRAAFDILNAGLDDDPALIDQWEKKPSNG
jgi:hypothetical protein